MTAVSLPGSGANEFHRNADFATHHTMASPRHFAWFIALGLFWGVSPSLYKHLADVRVPVSHTIFLTGLGVGLAMWLIAARRSGAWGMPWSTLRYGAICAFLMNIPFGFNLFLAGRVPPTELAIVITTSPFFAYLVALATGWEMPRHGD